MLNPIRWGPAFYWLPRYLFGFDTDDLLLLAGVLGIHDFRHPGYNNLRLPIGASLTLAWSGVLLFISSRGFLRVFHDGFHKHGEGPPSNAEPGGV